MEIFYTKDDLAGIIEGFSKQNIEEIDVFEFFKDKGVEVMNITLYYEENPSLIFFNCDFKTQKPTQN